MTHPNYKHVISQLTALFCACVLHRAQKQAAAVSANLIVIILAGASLLSVFAHVWWEMSHDTKPRDPYRR